ncbi:MAG: PEGA domain-containing protein, partial [Candidatus Hydrogenedentota bacterium]
MKVLHRSLPALLLLAASCTPTQLAIYSRPGGAEVYIDDRLYARTVNEATPVTLEVRSGKYGVSILKDGYHPWARTVDAKPYSVTPVLADLVPIEPIRTYVPIGAVEIRIHPAGARAWLDGQLLSQLPENAGEPFIIEGLTPEAHVLRVERQGYESEETRFEIFSQLVSNVTLRLEPLKPYYVYPSNDDLLRNAAVRALRGIAHLPGMRSTKTIGLVSLDGEADELDGLRPLVEDVMIAELARNGRGVVERENHLLVRLAQESARSDSFSLEVLTKHGGPDRPFLYDARLKSAADAIAMLATDTAGRARQIIVRNRVEEPLAHLKTADQIIGYRIVERSLRSDPIDDPGSPEPMIRREAIIRLFIRFLDAKTGIVQWAERFEASVADRVPQRVYRWLEHPPSRTYAYEMKQKPGRDARESRDTAAASPPIEYFTEDDLGGIGDQDILFWYWRNMGEAYLRAGRFGDAARHLREAVAIRPLDDTSAKLRDEAR